MKVLYTDHFVLPLPRGHRFPMAKYAMVRSAIMAARVVPPHALHVPEAATDTELLRVHDPAYLQRVATGTLSRDEVRRIGFPWSPELVERSRRSVGATISASRAALRDGVAVNLAGGTHHAFANAGEGFCVFNDAAVAARTVQAEGSAHRVLVVDCDVHQGNGTAAIFREDPTVFTFDVFGARNFPFHKEEGDLHIGLEDGTGDDRYLATLADGLGRALAAARPQLAIYVAGADPFSGDALGRLSLSPEGLAARDRLVFERCRRAGVAVAVTMGGGYAAAVEETVRIHVQTVRLAARAAQVWEAAVRGARKTEAARSSAARSPTSTTVSPGANRNDGSGV